jgi:hypothetical protein
MKISLRALRAFKQRNPNGTVAQFHYAYHQNQTIVMRRRNSWWRNHLAFIRRQSWPARICLILIDITIAYLAFILGMFVGVAILSTYANSAQ